MTPEQVLVVLGLVLGSNVLVELVRQWFQRSSPAKRDKEIIENYTELIREYRTKIIELTGEVERVEKEKQEDAAAHEIELSNQAAVILKRQIEYEQELKHLQNELMAYQIGWTKLRRVAVKYVPTDITLPEIDGATTRDVK